jgi:hypothetical protein
MGCVGNETKNGDEERGSAFADWAERSGIFAVGAALRSTPREISVK